MRRHKRIRVGDAKFRSLAVSQHLTRSPLFQYVDFGAWRFDRHNRKPSGSYESEGFDIQALRGGYGLPYGIIIRKPIAITTWPINTPVACQGPK